MRQNHIIYRCFFIIICFAIVATACKSTKPATKVAMDELYTTWRIDSVYMVGNFVPNSELEGGTITFTQDKKLITKTGKRENSITFEIVDNKIINTDKPADPTLNIEELTKEQLILKSENEGIVKLRMILSPLKF